MANTTGKKFAGREKGTPNKRNQEIADLAKELGCNPAKILMLIAVGDSEALSVSPLELDLDRRASAAKELMPYLYGKRKPIDSNGNDSIDPLTEIVNALRDK
jgi:hypothetical protein